jgi:uncharacterized damage-inducible protein DinB
VTGTAGLPESDPLAILAGVPRALRALLGGLPEEIALAPAAEGWSPRDVVAHLLTVRDLGGMARIRRVVEQDEPRIEPYDETAALQASGYRERPLGWLLLEFERKRREDVEWLRTLDEATLGRRGLHGEYGPVTAGELLHHIAYHDLDHLRQVASMLMPALDAGRGNMQKAP